MLCWWHCLCNLVSKVQRVFYTCYWNDGLRCVLQYQNVLVIFLIINPFLFCLNSQPVNLSAPPSSHSSPCTAWHKVSDSDLHCYCAQIANCLPSIPVDLIDCTDPSCVQHHSHLDQLCSCLFDCICQSASPNWPYIPQAIKNCQWWRHEKFRFL